jgi:hypothetical protein
LYEKKLKDLTERITSALKISDEYAIKQAEKVEKELRAE